MSTGKYKLLLICILCLGCQPEKGGEEKAEDAFIVRFDSLAGILGEGAKSGWVAGEEITINGVAYKAESAGQESKFLPVSASVPQSQAYIAAYPASLRLDGSVISGELPPEGPYSLSGVPVVQTAKSQGKKLILKNMLSYVTIANKAEGVHQAAIESLGGETLSGSFRIDYSGNDPSISLTSGSASSSAVSGKASFDKGIIVIPSIPRTLKSGYKVSFIFDSQHGGSRWSSAITDHTVFYRGSKTELGDFDYDFGTGTGYLSSMPGLTLGVNCDQQSTSPISPLIFGSYSEVHGGDIVPGICEQYIINPSMESWDGTGDKGESKNELLFTGNDVVAQVNGVAYPWEKRNLSKTPEFTQTSEERYNSELSQKISLSSGARAAFIQRLALPMYRTDKYKVRFHIKTSGDITLKLSFHEAGSREELVMSEVFEPSVSASDTWQTFEHEFTLAQSSDLFNGRYKLYNLWFEFSNDGTAWLDQVTLFPSDCVEGIFNPETLEYFKQYKVQAIRWPGGNFTSGYDWRNGIGSWEKRPSVKNRAWGGIDTNIMGTDEFIRFCTLVGMEPVMGVGYNRTLLSAQDIADWVEYCNGDASTTYGAKRAENGHPGPYKVKYWGVGNEVYGSYQLGNESAGSYASGFVDIASRMRSVDNSIKILATGQAVHNRYRGSYNGWTSTVNSYASSQIDLFDCHLYVYGNETSNNLNLDGESWFRIYAAANLNLRDFISAFRTEAPGKKLALLEWGVLPKITGSNLTPQRQTFANLLVSACEYHEMIRQSDVVEMAAMHNFSFFVAPQKLHSEPVNMRTVLIKEMSVLGGGYYVPVEEAMIPKYKQGVNVLDIGVREAVPEIDAVAVRKGESIYLSCVNRSPSSEYDLTLVLAGVTTDAPSGVTYTCSMPYAKSLWTNNFGYSAQQTKVSGTSTVTLPPLSYTLLKIPVKQ